MTLQAGLWVKTVTGDIFNLVFSILGRVFGHFGPRDPKNDPFFGPLPTMMFRYVYHFITVKYRPFAVFIDDFTEFISL
jgi:hypothetical protein